MAKRRIFVAGHRGMVGAALARRFAERDEVLTVEKAELDLLRQSEVEAWFAAHRPDAVALAAARVGGILANAERPADFLYENLVIAANVIHAAHAAGVARLLFLGSSCIYPKFAEQPIREDALLTGPLEPTNEAYAIAKIAGLKLCEAYRRQHGRAYVSLMPCNLYGPGDNFDPASSHVLAALIAKLHAAKLEGRAEAVVWGTGRPLREFLHVDDVTRAAEICLDSYDELGPLNCGSGEEVSVAALAEMIAEAVGYRGRLVYDPTKPDGTPRKLMESSRLRASGWRPTIALRDGIAAAYGWYLENEA